MEQIKVELQEWMGSDRSIAEAAWTSSTTLQGKEKRTDQDIERVVRMLIQQKHASPIESVVMRFWIKMPIQTDRQHMTHRIGSHNGMSGRYRTMPSEFYNIPDDVRDITNRALTGLTGSVSLAESTLKQYNEICSEANHTYSLLLKSFKDSEKANHISNNEYKRLREFYRGMLPQNNMTERVTVFNLRSFANYQHLRNSEHAQPEIRRVAELMLEEVLKKNIAPVAIDELIKTSWKI